MYNPEYPRIEINTKKLAANAKYIVDLCAKADIKVAGVVKVCDGNIDAAKTIAAAGAAQIATSRMRHLDALRKAGIDKPLLLVRIPMLSEVKDLVNTADISLVSSIEVVRKIDDESKAAGKVFSVILMLEMGDLREGIWGDDEILAAAKEIEAMENVYLMGVGMNVGCYGSIDPTPEKLDELVEKAEMVEAAIGRELEVISGGGSTSVPRVFEGTMPKRINHLRVGEGIIVNRDLKDLYGIDFPGMYNNVFVLKAEVVETQLKPSHPIGEIAFDAFRNKPTYVDRGDRKRAILGMGRGDYAFPDQIIPVDPKIEILGASSDHTLLDIEDVDHEVKVGDIIAFDLNYAPLLFATTSDDVVKVIVE
jgi:predicted amino acid racemase